MDNIGLSMRNEELQQMIRDEVIKVVSQMKDTLLLQLIGFVKEDQARIEKGEEPLVSVNSGAGGEGESKDNEIWFCEDDDDDLVIRSPLTPVEELEKYGQLTSPEVVGEYQAYECDGNSQRDTME